MRPRRKRRQLCRRDTKEYQDLFRELDSYEKQGVCMELEGKPASPTQIVRAHMIREEPGYMRDYVLNEKGDVKALYFDHVKKDR